MSYLLLKTFFVIIRTTILIEILGETINKGDLFKKLKIRKGKLRLGLFIINRGLYSKGKY